MAEYIMYVLMFAGAILLIGVLAMLSKWYRKARRGEALVRTGVGGTKVSFNGMIVVPVLHRLEVMEISLKRILISRDGKDGLVCKDNMRADIKVAFFVKVNPNIEDVKKVAQMVGCDRASSEDALRVLFEAKFSEALKTVGKRLDFIELYDARDKVRQEIVAAIGTDLNGYVLDDAAIDYLEQTPLEFLDEFNILDSEGIKKIVDLTSKQKVLANLIQRDKEKTITQQDVEAREAILELEKQLAETEQKQRREVETIKAREQAEIEKVTSEQRQISEQARIASDEEIMIAEENKQRQVIVALKSKERTNAVETERVEKDRLLEVTERERIVTLAQIEKEKAIETEKKNIQEVIRERVAIEKTVVDEEEKIKDTRAFAGADRQKTVTIKKAEEDAESNLVQEIKAAEAAKKAAEFHASQKLIDAQADQEAAMKQAEAIKTLADAEASKLAAHGIAEAQVMQAKAAAHEKEGDAAAAVIEAEAMATAKGIQAKSNAQAEADHRIGGAAAKVELEKGLAQAEVISKLAAAEEERGMAEAKVIHQKADAMKQLDGVGKDHEEFKLRLDKEKQIELAAIAVQKDIADAQAKVIATALQSAKIDIVGGENVFFDKIIQSISNGKAVDKVIGNSTILTDVKNQLLDTSNGGGFKDNLKHLIDQFGIKSDDVKNLSIAALLFKMMNSTKDEKTKGVLNHLMDAAKTFGMGDSKASDLGI